MKKLTKTQIKTRLGIGYAIKCYQELISNSKQDPDSVIFDKQWDEFGYLKGWIVTIIYLGLENDLEITLDITPYYIRTIGDIEKIPDYICGKHQYFDYDEKNIVKNEKN